MAENDSNDGLFDGRATRSEYWQIALAQFGMGLLFFLMVLFMDFMKVLDSQDDLLLLSIIWGGLVFIVGLSVMVRRLHDLNLSGWWVLVFILLLLIPYVNAIVVIVNLILLGFPPGTKGRNNYGPDPLLPESNPQAQTNASSVDIKMRLDDLKTLLDTGEISYEEYSAQRERILKDL